MQQFRINLTVTETATITVRYFCSAHCHPVLISPPPPKFWCYKELLKAGRPMDKALSCTLLCPGTAAALALTASVGTGALKSHRSAALTFRKRTVTITHTGPREVAIPSKQEAGIELEQFWSAGIFGEHVAQHLAQLLGNLRLFSSRNS